MKDGLRSLGTKRGGYLLDDVIANTHCRGENKYEQDHTDYSHHEAGNGLTPAPAPNVSPADSRTPEHDSEDREDQADDGNQEQDEPKDSKDQGSGGEPIRRWSCRRGVGRLR